jgi:endonuclease/exonuclease/phosphatase (EEP) superfamily protein YafD
MDVAAPRRSPARRVLRWVVSLLAVCLSIFVVARLLGGTWLPWPGPSLLAFTPYVLVGSVVLLVVAGLLRHRPALAVAGVGAIVLAVVVLPRTVARDQPAVPGGRTLVVMNANLLHGHAHPDGLAALIRKRHPDVLSLEEASPKFIAKLRRQGIDVELPHRVSMGGGRWHDTAVMSRWPLKRISTALPTVFFPVAVAVPGGRPVPVMSAHPTPPVTPTAQRRWRAWLGAVPAPEGALAGGIVAGDFNATLDHGELRRILGLGWRDAGRERGAGLTPTWHAKRALQLTIDHVLVPPGAAVEDYVVDDLPGSDHRAVTATVVLPRTAP